MLQLCPFGTKAYNFAFRHPKDDARINILEGSVRSSKTTAMLVKLRALMNYPVGGRKLITGVTKQTIYNNVLADLFELVGEGHYRYNRSSGELEVCGSQWQVIGAKDEGSEKYIRGSTFGVGYADEGSLLPASFFRMLVNRLSPPGARLYVTTNPDNPYHYLKVDFLDNAAMRARRDVFSEHFTLDDNPNLAPEYVEFVKRAYTGVFYKRFILGEWVMAEGSIYADVLTDDIFYEDTPVGLRGPGGHIERIIAIDYGTTNPMVFIDIYDDGETAWFDREYYWDSRKEGRQKSDGEYADDLIKFMGGRPDAACVVLDPSAASFRVELVSRGVVVLDADNDVDDGIRMTATMLARKRLRINKKRCPNGVKEMQTYAWDAKKTDKGKEEPIKLHDHYPDAGRYFVKTRISPWRLAA